VAGVAALLWSQNPELTDDEVEAKLLSSTRYTPAMNRPNTVRA
jgi:subtilisin family serine protease